VSYALFLNNKKPNTALTAAKGISEVIKIRLNFDFMLSLRFFISPYVDFRTKFHYKFIRKLQFFPRYLQKKMQFFYFNFQRFEKQGIETIVFLRFKLFLSALNNNFAVWFCKNNHFFAITKYKFDTERLNNEKSFYLH
jgi:hypothetical protein